MSRQYEKPYVELIYHHENSETYKKVILKSLLEDSIAPEVLPEVLYECVRFARVWCENPPTKQGSDEAVEQ